LQTGTSPSATPSATDLDQLVDEARAAIGEMVYQHKQPKPRREWLVVSYDGYWVERIVVDGTRIEVWSEWDDGCAILKATMEDNGNGFQVTDYEYENGRVSRERQFFLDYSLAGGLMRGLTLEQRVSEPHHPTRTFELKPQGTP
jgi:hypothetical protein